MKCFAELAKDFFQTEREELLKNYPGITLQRLIQELETYALSMNVRRSDFLNLAYIKSINDPISDFFLKLKKGVPLGHITGRHFFYKSEFIVNSNVLIPRYETELLVETVSNVVGSRLDEISGPVRIADVGTGQGAIIISLMQEIQKPTLAFGIDISPEAIAIARQNYFNLRFTINEKSSLELLVLDRFNGFNKKLHYIVSNPPYIKESADRHLVHEQVQSYEPHQALFLADSEYYDWFSSFFFQSFELLFDDGMLFMEGHENHLEDLVPLASNVGFTDIKIIKDLTGANRIMTGKKEKKHGPTTN